MASQNIKRPIIPTTSKEQTHSSPPKVAMTRSLSNLVPDNKVYKEGLGYRNKILENLEQSGNIKKTIKDEIIKCTENLFDLFSELNIDKTELSREVMSVLLQKIDDTSAIKQYNQELSDIKNTLDELVSKRNDGEDKQQINQETIDINRKLNKLMEQITIENSKLKQENLELKAELKSLKENIDSKMLIELKNQNTIIKETHQEIKNLKDIIKTKPDTEIEMLEELRKQNAINEQTQQDLRQLSADIIAKPANTINQEASPSATISRSYAEVVTAERPKPTLCLLVGTNNNTDTSEEVITKIKKTLNARDTGLQISKLRKVKDQKVIIGCEKKEDFEQIKEKLEHHKFKVEIKPNKDPLVIIRNLTKSITDEEILQSLDKQNSDILDHIPNEEYRIKVRHRRRARNPAENHVVLEVSPQVWTALTTAGKVYVDIQRVPVFDLSPLVQCSRCLAFGHGKKWCSEAVDLCSHCTGPHMSTECPSLLAGEEPTCKNCQQAKCIKTNHNSFDLRCPVRKKWDSLARSSIAYS